MKEVILTFFVLYVHVECRLLPPMTSFSKELIFSDNRILLSESQNVVTNHESYLYAICDNQKHTFSEDHCNVTIETPAFINASFKDTCMINLSPPNPKLEIISKVGLYAVGDEQVLLSWLIKDHDFQTKSARVRILRMTDCISIDVPIPAYDILKVIPYENTFDVILNNKTFCGSDNCRLTYDVEGKKLSGPTQFLPKLKFSSLLLLIPVNPETSAKGFYAQVLIDHDPKRFHLLYISPTGKETDLAKTADVENVRMSNAYDLFSVCISKDRTNITCRQYDVKMNLKMNTILNFHDEPGTNVARWMQPHNLQDGGILLLTGQITGKDGKKFESFSVIKIHPNGKHDRPLEVERGLDLECTNHQRFFVTVTENEVDEYCFHFVCDHQEFNDHHGIVDAVKFVTKCLTRTYVGMIKRRSSIVN